MAIRPVRSDGWRQRRLAETQPFFHRYAGVMQIDERIGGFCILETDRMRLKMLIHRQVNSLSIMFRKGLN
jgi:hypothetical protein